MTNLEIAGYIYLAITHIGGAFLAAWCATTKPDPYGYNALGILLFLLAGSLIVAIAIPCGLFSLLSDRYPILEKVTVEMVLGLFIIISTASMIIDYQKYENQERIK